MRGVELQHRLIKERQEKIEAEPAAGGEEVPAVDGGEGLVEDDVARDEWVGCYFILDENEKQEENGAYGKGDDTK